MKTEIAVAIISFLGTLLGTLGGIIASGKLTVYRISQLEKKVDELTEHIKMLPLMEKEQQIANKRIENLEHCSGFNVLAN